MKKSFLGIGVVAFLILGAGAIQGIVRRTVVPPDASKGLSRAALNQHLNPLVARTPKEIAQARRNSAEEFRYKGTTVVAGGDLDHEDVWVKKAIEILTSTDFIPDQRVQRFSSLAPKFTVVGWHLTIEVLDVREEDSFVRVRSAPLLRAPGEGHIGVFTSYREEYRIAGGELQFLRGEPMPENMNIGFAIQ